ncbi:DUF692 family multinuclear iron-containing protein [Streptomyces sp. NPDC005538]|uniref:multinuclear nonheme iron-dependent oxidase n=1 Tax=unclassified Streptomyces TaxID=2593676 RepID=UPI0033BE9C2D
MAEVSNCRWIGEHIGMTGTRATYSGTFLQPLGTDEQTQVFIDNLRRANETSAVPLIVENQPQVFNQVGPRAVCEQVADIAVGADAGILLSLSNIVISDAFHPMDREREIAHIPLDRVWQVHLPLANEAELAEPVHEVTRQNEKWHFATLEALFREKDFRPAAVIWRYRPAAPVPPGARTHTRPARLDPRPHAPLRGRRGGRRSGGRPMSLAGLQQLLARSVRDADFRHTVLAPGGLDTAATELGLTEEEKRLFTEIEASYLHGIADFVLAQRIQRREAEFALFLNALFRYTLRDAFFRAYHQATAVGQFDRMEELRRFADFSLDHIVAHALPEHLVDILRFC